MKVMGWNDSGMLVIPTAERDLKLVFKVSRCARNDNDGLEMRVMGWNDSGMLVMPSAVGILLEGLSSRW